MDSSQEDNKKQQIKRKLKKENSKLTANIERTKQRQKCFFEKNKNVIILWYK